MSDLPSLISSLGDDQPVKCPRCQSDAGLHFDEVTLIDPAGDVVALHAEGSEGLSVVTATIGDAVSSSRCHLIVLPHWCADCGQRGSIVLRQRLGQTFGTYHEVESETS